MATLKIILHTNAGAHLNIIIKLMLRYFASHVRYNVLTVLVRQIYSALIVR